MTTQANPTLGNIEDVIQKYGLYVLAEIGLKALFTYYPVLNVWPLNQIITGITHFINDQISSLLRLEIDLAAIKIVNDSHRAQFERSVVVLRILAHEQGIDSDAFKKGRENAKANFATLVRFNGA